MTTLTKLNPKTAADRLKAGDAVLIDIRERDEYAREHIPGAISLPVSALDDADLTLEADQHAIFHCKSGMRTDANCARLAQHVDGEAFTLEGGLDAWRALGLPTAKDAKAPLEINRQVQITSGSLVLIGVLLGWFVTPALFGLSAFVGAGLMFAGISGWCGMATLLQAMPWNRRQSA
ncbi:MAG: rhodanese family protein [Henriciella sp.]|nr:rhodanese family protein [Henriciella sp.]